MGTLFKNGTVINAGDSFVGDVLVEGEKIVLIGQNIPKGNHKVIDCKGKYVMPGGIDVHTHLDMPFGGTSSSDDFNTGHQAAAFGGTTMHIDFVLQPKGHSLHSALETWHKKANGKAQIDYGFHVAITDLTPDVMKEIPTLVDEGVTSLKLFMAYKGVFQIDDQTMFRTMQIAAENGMLVMVHAENGDAVDDLIHKYVGEGKLAPKYHAASRPALLEGEATGRAISLAGVADSSLYVVHMTCDESISQLRLGRKHGIKSMGETCIQYLFLTEKDLDRPGNEGAKFVCSPPIRTEADQEVLWEALRDGTLQVVSTDHCPFWFDGTKPGRIPGKELGAGDFSKIPNGLPAIEDRQMMLWHFGVNGGRISANRFVELTATNPAKIFGMYPRKGTISVGADADIAVWDPKARYTISAATQHMRTDYNIFEGTKVRGKPVMVWVRGQQVVDGDKWTGTQGSGQFIKRSPHAQVL